MKFDSKYNFVEKRNLIGERELKRLIEIKFFLTFKPLYELIDNQEFNRGGDLGRELIGIISLLCDIDLSVMKLAFSKMYSKNARPTKREIAVALRFFGLSYKEIKELFGISHVTIMKYSREYFEDDNMQFTPMIDDDSIHDLLEKALIPIHMFFLPMSKICYILYKSQLKKGE